ncbi:hypothetical protein HDU76_011583, partial [Blyttiomyces sp. JEL0837]
MTFHQRSGYTEHTAFTREAPIASPKFNITIAAFLPYSLGDLYTSTTIQDAEIELAVNETNADPDVLPDFN